MWVHCRFQAFWNSETHECMHAWLYEPNQHSWYCKLKAESFIIVNINVNINSIRIVNGISIKCLKVGISTHSNNWICVHIHKCIYIDESTNQWIVIIWDIATELELDKYIWSSNGYFDPIFVCVCFFSWCDYEDTCSFSYSMSHSIQFSSFNQQFNNSINHSRPFCMHMYLNLGCAVFCLLGPSSMGISLVIVKVLTHS